MRSEFVALSGSVGKIDEKLDRLIPVLIAGLIAVIATLIGVGRHHLAMQHLTPRHPVMC